MAATYYAQNDAPEPTMTVAELIKRLYAFAPDAPVVFRTPLHGSFGANTAYSIERLDEVSLPRKEQHYPAARGLDEETGEEYEAEPYTQVWHAWTGIVIS